MEKFGAWVDGVDDEAGELAYRYVYAAYLWACTGGDHPYGMTVETLPGRGHVLRYGRSLELRVADERERRAFADYLVSRYCSDACPDMAAWEARQHQWYVEDLDW